jgi:membrane protein involved in colicin uptake
MPLAHQIAAYKSWANTPNRSARTAKARNALEQKFLAEAGGDPQRAEAARKAYYLELALKSAKARQRRRETERAARQDIINALLRDLDGGGGNVAYASSQL